MVACHMTGFEGAQSTIFNGTQTRDCSDACTVHPVYLQCTLHPVQMHVQCIQFWYNVHCIRFGCLYIGVKHYTTSKVLKMTSFQTEAEILVTFWLIPIPCYISQSLLATLLGAPKGV